MLEPSVQNLAYDAFTATVGSDLFILSALHMNGYGCIADSEKSLRYLRQAASFGHNVSQAYILRIFRSVSGAEYLFHYASNGSRTALMDLLSTEGVERYNCA